MKNKILEITSIPNRKNKYLCIVEGAVHEPIARFINEESVDKFLEFCKSKGVLDETI